MPAVRPAAAPVRGVRYRGDAVTEDAISGAHRARPERWH
jgi:hypothetical protein